MANTALMELIEYLEKYKDVIGGTSVMIIDKCKALLPKERQDIEDAYNQGDEDGYHFTGSVSDYESAGRGKQAAANYFTQTFKQ